MNYIQKSKIISMKNQMKVVMLAYAIKDFIILFLLASQKTQKKI
jgi:hypothetical protein